MKPGLLSRLRSWVSSRQGIQSASAQMGVQVEAGPRAERSTADLTGRPVSDVEAIVAVDPGSPLSRQRALSSLRRAAGTESERRALAACRVAHTQERAPSELVCLAAELLARRGEPEEALALLDGQQDPRAWLLAADLRAERGQFAVAERLVERVLSRDIDAPGAIERWRRWTPARPSPLPELDQPTLLGRDAPSTSLRIVGEAGRGGAATVYRAEDEPLGRSVALKIYHDPERARDQLLREARMAVRFAGPGVIRVFDADAEQGFVVIEWASGGSLEQRLARGMVTEDHAALSWFRALLGEVSRLHDAGFVHADLKPANILFRSSGEALLSDFGLAVPVGARHLGASAGYTAPERAAGRVACLEDDVYGLGRVLEQVVGRAGPRLPSELAKRLGRVAEIAVSPNRPRDARELWNLLP